MGDVPPKLLHLLILSSIICDGCEFELIFLQLPRPEICHQRNGGLLFLLLLFPERLPSTFLFCSVQITHMHCVAPFCISNINLHFALIFESCNYSPTTIMWDQYAEASKLSSREHQIKTEVRKIKAWSDLNNAHWNKRTSGIRELWKPQFKNYGGQITWELTFRTGEGRHSLHFAVMDSPIDADPFSFWHKISY